MKKLFAFLTIVLVLVGCFASVAGAVTIDDLIGEAGGNGQQEFIPEGSSGGSSSGGNSGGSVNPAQDFKSAIGYDENYDNEFSNNAMADYIQNYQGVTPENMQYAEAIASPIVAVIGTITGVLAILVIALVPFTTILDLLYISFPPVRGFLYQGGSGMNNGQVGMNNGANAHAQRQWVSDDAVKAAMLLGANATENQVERSGNNMYGMNMGGNVGAQQNPASGRGSVIGFYLKKRIGFYILFAIALVLLLSSAFMNFGINIVQFIMSILHSWGLF